MSSCFSQTSSHSLFLLSSLHNPPIGMVYRLYAVDRLSDIYHFKHHRKKYIYTAGGGGGG